MNDTWNKINKAIADVVWLLTLVAVPVAVVFTVLFGPNVPFFGGVVANLLALVDHLAAVPLVGAFALVFILYIFWGANELSTDGGSGTAQSSSPAAGPPPPPPPGLTPPTQPGGPTY